MSMAAILTYRGEVSRFVVDAGTALRIVTEGVVVAPGHELLAPTLWRSSRRPSGSSRCPGADEVGEVLGETGKKLWGAAWNHTTQLTTDTITETFGSATDAEIARQIRQAQLGREGVQIRSAQALLQAGLIELPQNYEDTWLQGQRIIPIGDITDDEWMGFVNESAALLGKVLDGSDIDDQYQDPFGSWNFDK